MTGSPPDSLLDHFSQIPLHAKIALEFSTLPPILCGAAAGASVDQNGL
jgi:hypothetical protein